MVCPGWDCVDVAPIVMVSSQSLYVDRRALLLKLVADLKFNVAHSSSILLYSNYYFDLIWLCEIRWSVIIIIIIINDIFIAQIRKFTKCATGS